MDFVCYIFELVFKEDSLSFFTTTPNFLTLQLSLKLPLYWAPYQTIGPHKNKTLQQHMSYCPKRVAISRKETGPGLTCQEASKKTVWASRKPPWLMENY